MFFENQFDIAKIRNVGWTSIRPVDVIEQLPLET